MATITGSVEPAHAARPVAAVGPWAIAGVASIGAGAVHAAAIGVHAEHAQAARLFAVLAVAQIAWGVVALSARSRAVAVGGAALALAAIGGWVAAKTTGIGFVDGLAEPEEVQLPDAVAAALAAVSLLALARGLLVGATRGESVRPRPVVLHGVGAVVVLASLLGMAEVGSHEHAGGHGHGEATLADSDHDDDHGPAPAVPPRPFDPDRPIDLSGVPGVSPEQQARAENLLAITIDRLPKYADVSAAEADGFRSIGDGFTGHEHFMNWAYIDDEHVLNPDYPESLVYEVGPDGERTLVSAMFMTKPGVRLDDVPDIGGPLTQWHVHDDLCFTDDPENPRVAGVTSVGGTCTPPLQKFDPTPMIHVWITPHPCGPFAALEGVAAGQVKPGEEHLCNELHGGH
jgi:hypothetical protein